MALNQAVIGVAYRGLHYLPDAMLPDDKLMMRWVAMATKVERKNNVMNDAIVTLHKELTEAGLSPILLKGQGAASFYEHPELRECGDIDFCFAPQEAMSQAAEMMRERGVNVKHYATDNSDAYKWHGVIVEHHMGMFDLCNPRSKGFLRQMTESDAATTHITIKAKSGDTEVAVPAPVPCLLLLSSHILIHTMGHGIGLRQYCDIARAYHMLQGRYRQADLIEAYEKTGLTKWNRLLNSFLITHLGVDKNVLPNIGRDTKSLERLTKMVMSSGNFGLHNDSRGKSTQTKWHRKWKTFQSFVRHSRTTMVWAPAETICAIARSVVGNL